MRRVLVGMLASYVALVACASERAPLVDVPTTIRFMDIGTNRPVPHFRFRWMNGTPRLPQYQTAEDRAAWKTVIADASGEYRMAYSGEGTITIESLVEGLVTECDPHLCFVPLHGAETTFSVRIGRPCTLSGRVYDAESGAAFQGVRVTLSNRGGYRTYEATTDVDGRYQFNEILPGRYHVERATVDGFDEAFVDSGLRYLDAKTGYNIANANFPMKRATHAVARHGKGAGLIPATPAPVGEPGLVQGRLFDVEGKPAENIEVIVQGIPHAQCVTDEHGNFAFSSLSPGVYPLDIRYDDFAYRRLWLNTGVRRVALVLQDPEPLEQRPPPPVPPDSTPAYSFSVCVLDDATQKPIQRYVCGWTSPADWYARQRPFDSCDIVFTANGSHSVDRQVWHSPYLVSVYADGYATSTLLQTIDPVLHAYSPPTLVFRMQRAATIEGVVVTPDGTRVSGARIVADARPGPERIAPARTQNPIAVSGEDGTFVISAAPLTPLFLTAFDDRWGRVTKQVAPAAASASNVMLQFAHSTSLTLEVRCGDVAQANAEVSLTFQDPTAQTEFGGDYTTDIAGRLDLPHATPSRGVAEIRVDHPHAHFTRMRTIAFEATEKAPANVCCQFSPGCAALLGHVRADGEVPLNVLLTLTFPDCGETISSEVLQGGDVVLNNLPSGRADAVFTIRTSQRVYMKSLRLRFHPGHVTRANLSY